MCSYLDKQEFLNRVDQRQFEKERAQRERERIQRDNERRQSRRLVLCSQTEEEWSIGSVSG